MTPKYFNDNVILCKIIDFSKLKCIPAFFLNILSLKVSFLKKQVGIQPKTAKSQPINCITF